MSDDKLRTQDDPRLWPEEQPAPPRRVVAVSTGPHGTPTVFCDDGAVFRLTGHLDWLEMSPVPGTAAAREQE